MKNDTISANFTIANSTVPDASPGTIILAALINWFSIFSIIATFSLNGLIIFAYAVRTELRTPFNAYIVNIAISEALAAVVFMPCNFIQSYYGYWPYNAMSCTFRVYTSLILSTGARYGHALISANRIWAVTFPLSYRTDHTNRVSHVVIGVTWLFLHILFLPSIIWGRENMGTVSDDPYCHNDISQQMTSAVLSEVIGFDLPQVFIVVTFPYILWKLHQKRFNSVNVQKMPIPVVEDAKARGVQEQETGANVKSTSTSAGQQRNRQDSRSQNKVLIFLVIGTIICWTPNHVYFLIVDTSQGYWDKAFNTVQFFLQYSYSWGNPILCYMAMGQLRKVINDLIRCRSARGSS